MDTAEAKEFAPSVVFVDADNRIVGTGSDPAEVYPEEVAQRPSRRALPGMELVRGDLHSFAPSDLAGR
jgi:aspartate 1-decarboxylase